MLAIFSSRKVCLRKKAGVIEFQPTKYDPGACCSPCLEVYGSVRIRRRVGERTVEWSRFSSRAARRSSIAALEAAAREE